MFRWETFICWDKRERRYVVYQRHQRRRESPVTQFRAAGIYRSRAEARAAKRWLDGFAKNHHPHPRIAQAPDIEERLRDLLLFESLSPRLASQERKLTALRKELGRIADDGLPFEDTQCVECGRVFRRVAGRHSSRIRCWICSPTKQTPAEYGRSWRAANQHRARAYREGHNPSTAPDALRSFAQSLRDRQERQGYEPHPVVDAVLELIDHA